MSREEATRILLAFADVRARTLVELLDRDELSFHREVARTDVESLEHALVILETPCDEEWVAKLCRTGTETIRKAIRAKTGGKPA